jgi:hypothetical protein
MSGRAPSNEPSGLLATILTTAKDGFADEILWNELRTAVATGLGPMFESRAGRTDKGWKS